MTENPTILLATDAPEGDDALQQALEREGYRVVVGRRGGQGLELARRERPDLVISDLEMSDMDGCEMGLRIRQTDGLDGVPVLLLLAADETERLLARVRELLAGRVASPAAPLRAVAPAAEATLD